MEDNLEFNCSVFTQQIVYTIFQSMKFKTLISINAKTDNLHFQNSYKYKYICTKNQIFCYLKFPTFNKNCKKTKQFVEVVIFCKGLPKAKNTKKFNNG